MPIRTLLLTLALSALATPALRGQSGPTARAAADARSREADVALYREAARHAWASVARSTSPRTGLIGALPEYPYATAWDIGSGLAALYSAYGLGLIGTEEYDDRMGRMLRTLRGVGLVDGTAFNKFYAVRTGEMVDRQDRPTTVGLGWSALDLGRLLVWLRIVAEHHPQHAEAARAVAGRIRYDQVVRGGYLHGGEVGRGRVVTTHQEGQIGYEQYAATGFALWGHRAHKALDLRENTRPIRVGSHWVLADTRGHNKLTSEPLVLMGLELGWPPEVRSLAEGVLAAQEERYRTTGQVTIVSEDAVNVPPHYFYYYCVHCNGKAFSVDAPGVARRRLDAPRWISTKAAFGWHALLPGEYTRIALEAVQPALRVGRGWSSGIFEKNGAPTASENVNTHAVILEAALYLVRGRPLLKAPEALP